MTDRKTVPATATATAASTIAPSIQIQGKPLPMSKVAPSAAPMFSSGAASASNSANTKTFDPSLLQEDDPDTTMHVHYYLGDHDREQQLLQWLVQALENSVFRKYHNLDRNYKCTCTAKKPCTPAIDHSFIFELLRNQGGICKSCDMRLQLFQFDGSLKQPMQVFTMPSFHPGRCKIMGDPTTRSVEYIFCHGCTALMEACYHDKLIFNHYRQLMFPGVHQSGNPNVVEAFHFPRLDHIDRAGRSVRIVNMKLAGKKRAIYMQWLRQRGFVVYPLPQSLQAKILQHKMKMQASSSAAGAASPALAPAPTSQSAHHAADGNPDDFLDNDSDDSGSDDDHDDDHGDDHHEDSSSSQSRSSSRDDDKDYVRPPKRRRVTAVEDDADGNGDVDTKKQREANYDASAKSASVSGSTSLKLQSAAKRQRPRGVEVATSDLCENNPAFICFKIAIDPRKSARSKSLSYVALTPMDRAQPISAQNYLFTTQLLRLLEDKLEYGDFIRWAISTFRQTAPTFVRPDANGHSKAVALAESKSNELVRLRDVAIREKQLRDQASKVREEIKLLMREKQEVTSKWIPDLLRAYEANESMDFLRSFDLVPRLASRKGVVKALTESFVADVLPALLAKHELIERGDAAAVQVYPICKKIAQELFSDELRGRTPSRSTFALKLAAPPKEPGASTKAKTKSKKGTTAATTKTGGAAGKSKQKTVNGTAMAMQATTKEQPNAVAGLGIIAAASNGAAKMQQAQAQARAALAPAAGIQRPVVGTAPPVRAPSIAGTSMNMAMPPGTVGIANATVNKVR